MYVEHKNGIEQCKQKEERKQKEIEEGISST